jgi:prevent-host-death family protein
MDTIGAFEAKAHFSELLARVETGESIQITRNGKPIARLVPEVAPIPGMTVAEAIEGLIEFRKGRHMSCAEILELVREGRKY